MAEPPPGLHPAQNRGLRELYAFARQMASHWERLAPRIGAGDAPAALDAGAAAARELLVELGELTPQYGLYGFPAAQNVGARLAGLRNAVGDRTLERNQAMRMAVLDAQHVTTLLAYLAELGRSQGDRRMQEFCGRWEQRIRQPESACRRAAVALGDEPDGAIEPLDRGPVGRAGHRAQYAIGSLGEWFDRRTAQRHGRHRP